MASEAVDLALAILMIYFATLAPTIAFGGLLQEDTKSKIGITETMLCQGCVGVVAAIFGGQHLSILRPTGPVVAFIGVVYLEADVLQVDFLQFWSMTAVCCGVFLIIFALLDLAYFIKFVTNFTEDVFSALISTLFLYAAFKHMKIYLNDEAHATIAILSIVLLFGTTVICQTAKRFQNSTRLTVLVRELVSNFNMLVAIIIMTGFSEIYLKNRFWHVGCKSCSIAGSCTERESSQVELANNISCAIGDVPQLQVPSEAFIPTYEREWLVPFWDLTDGAAIGQAVLLGFLLALLFFVEQNITSVMLDKPVNKLKGKPTFHWDMFVVGVCVIVCGIFGLPVAHASLPHSIYHIQALANKEHMPPSFLKRNYKVKVNSVTETRMSAFMINLLILFTIPLLDWMSMVPLPVVYGLFFYMGWSSLVTNDLAERILLFFTEPALYPPNHVFRQVEPPYIHLYTIIQILCLLAIWLVKATKAISAYFPIVIMLMIPLKIYILPLLFNDDPKVQVQWPGPDGKQTPMKLKHIIQEASQVCDNIVEHLTKQNADPRVTLRDTIRRSQVPDKVEVKGFDRTTNLQNLLDELRIPHHSEPKFMRLAKSTRFAMQTLANEPEVTTEQKDKLEALITGLREIAKSPPVRRLDFLDPHEDHSGSNDHHEKKG